jgi:hypothetical protein
MNDPATISDFPPAMDLSVEAQPGPDGRDLERRVQSLEKEISDLKDTKALEDRVANRVTERLQKTTFSDKFTANPPAGGFPPQPPYAQALPIPRGKFAWLFFDMYADARFFFLMIFDKRYTLAWTTHVVLWLLIPAILTSGWWFPGAYIPFLGPYLDKVLDLILAFFVYKTLSREVSRYRQMLGHAR